MQSPFSPSPPPQAYWSPVWGGNSAAMFPGMTIAHSPDSITRSGTPPSLGPAHEPTHNRAPLPEEEMALRQILASKQRLASHVDGLIKEAADSAKTLERPYRELKELYESAEASYVAGHHYVSELVRVRQAMQPSVNAIKSLLHPIRRYPSDILSLIFIATVESERSYDYSIETDSMAPSPRYKRRHAALDISHVCRAWRALAHATPEMWSTVRLNLSRRSHAANKLALFARHAKAVPLNVVIHRLAPSFFPSYASTDSDDEETITPLFNSVNHLRSLEINFNHFRALSCLWRLGTSKVEQLQELSLRSDPVMLPTTPDFSLTDYLSTAKNLRRLTLTHIALSLSLHNVNLVLSTVTHLIVQAPSSADAGFVSLPHYLAMMPNLVKLVYFQNDNFTAASMGMVEMPMLETISTNFLALTNSFATSFSAGRVHAPSLRKITLFSEGQDVSAPLDNLVAANPTIRKLQLQGDFDPIPQPGQPIIFKHASPLHTLVVTRACRRFVEVLCAMDEDGSPLVLPFLSRLKIECARTWCATMMPIEFERLFKSRCEALNGEKLTCIGAQQLRHFTFITHDGITDQTRAAIERRMKCVRHYENERHLLFRWHAESGSHPTQEDDILEAALSPPAELV